MIQLSERTLGDWLEHWAKETPDKEYIVYSDRNLRFTWSQFNRRVDNMAKGLLAIGITHGTHVGIWARNVPDWLTFLYACAKIGAVAVTVNTNYKQAELEYLCENSDMHTLCIVDGEKDSSFVDMTYRMLPELKTFERGHMKSKRFPHMRNVIYIGQEKYRGIQHDRNPSAGKQHRRYRTRRSKEKSQLPRYGKHAIYFRYNGIPERSNAYAL